MNNPRFAIGFAVSRSLLTGALLLGGSSCAIESETDETAADEAIDTTAEDVMVSATPQCISIEFHLGIFPPSNDPFAEYLIPVAGNHSSQCLLAQGAQNVAVTYLQIAMRDCYELPVAADGDFGPLTKQALIRVQRAIGVTADGVYGPQTHSKMKFEMSPDEINPAPFPSSAFCAVTRP